MTRIQLSRRKGWRKPAGAIVVSRPTRWGNPLNAKVYGSAGAVEMYRQHLAEITPAEREAYLAPLRGATALCCWCPPGEPCHADVLIEMVEARP